VAARRKKIVVFLALVALSSSVLVMRSARSNQTEPQEQSLGGLPNLTLPVESTAPLLRGEAPSGADTGELFHKMMFSVLLVVGLGAAAIYISKKYLPKITNLAGKNVRIVETIHLGPRKMIHVIKAGNRKLLIGSTNENITLLADLTNEPAEVSNENKVEEVAYGR
jgi:flagellar biosynthetic protein FliO